MDILQWGVDLILAIQSHRTEALDHFFRAITQLGGKLHMFVVPFFIWSLSYRMGSRLLITLLLSAAGNFAFKDLFAQPRPFDLDPRIGPDREEGFGIPSGHAQHTLVEWGGLAAWVGQAWFWAVAAVLIALIGFSRVYLGVHFPTDVLAGWSIAIVILVLHIRFADRIATRLTAMNMLQQIVVAAVVSLLIVASYLMSMKTVYIIGVAGLLLGSGIGISLCHRYLCAPEDGELWQRGLRYATGIVVLLIYIKVGGKLVPVPHDLPYFVTIYLVNAGAGLWLTAGAPAMFQLLRLSPPAATT